MAAASSHEGEGLDLSGSRWRPQQFDSILADALCVGPGQGSCHSPEPESITSDSGDISVLRKRDASQCITPGKENEGDTWVHRHMCCQREAGKCLPHMLRLSGKFLNWTTTSTHPCMRPDQPWPGPNKSATPPRCWVCRGSSALGSAGPVIATLTTNFNLCLRLVIKQPREEDKSSIMRIFGITVITSLSFVMCTYLAMTSLASCLFDIHFYTPQR